jgi:hypothetical protein
MLLVGVAIFCLIFQPTVFAASPKDTMLDSSFTLKIENTAKIDSELQLTMLGAIEDSRCPSDVTCVWEGTVSVQVNLIKNDLNLGNHTIRLGENDDQQIFDGYFVKLVTVEPYPLSTTSIKPSDYVMTFLVSKINETKIDAPLKQFNIGISINNIQCNADLVLVIKSSNFNPACVRSTTAEKLFFRGWAEVENTSYITPIIKTGTYAGHCLGYCAKEFIITHDKIIFTQNGHNFVSDEWSDLLEKTKESQPSQTEWNELTDLIDFDQFSSLPDKIGCPGCADAPVEWIEISLDGKTKRIEFENGDKIPEISKLIDVLQEIRNRVDSIDSFEKCVLDGNSVMESYPRQCKTADGKNFVEEIDDVLETPHEIEGKRSPVNVPDATNENDLLCKTRWNIETTKDLDTEYIKNSIQSTIAQFGITYFLEDREIIVLENSSGYTVSISGLWNPESVQYSMISEDLKNVSGVDVHGEPAMCT